MKQTVEEAKDIKEITKLLKDGIVGYYPLFKFFSEQHNLTLLDSEIQEIIRSVNDFQGAASLPTNSMQWVGASERLPEMKRYYNCKLQGLPVAFWIDKKNDAIVNNKGDEMPKILWDQIFWLDESAPTEPNGQ